MNALPNGLDQLRHWLISAQRGKLLYDEGEFPEAFYRVESGCVRLQTTRENGARQVLAFCFAGDVFGLDSHGTRRCAAEAASNCELTRFPIGQIESGHIPPEKAKILVAAAADMVDNLSRHLKGLGYTLAEDRLLWFIDWLADRQGQSRLSAPVQLPTSRRDIADFLSLTPETLSRAFARLGRRRLIRVIDRKHIILRPPSLLTAVREDGSRRALPSRMAAGETVRPFRAAPRLVETDPAEALQPGPCGDPPLKEAVQ